jgi:hypothetical protein
MSQTSNCPPYRYALLKRIQRSCQPVENKMANLSLNEFQKIHDCAIGEQESDIWLSRLTDNLKQLTRDIKQIPKVRGELLAHFVYGDILAIKESYRGVHIPQNHFLTTLPCIKINFKGQITCHDVNTVNEQLRWLFMPVMYRLLKNISVPDLAKLP